jgi:predicted transposase/invertase (TIGR01784 family)
VDGTQLYDWAKFIDARTKEELTMVAERNPDIARAVVKLRELSADERARDLFERHEKARRDLESHKRWERRLGIQEGRQEGRQESLQIVAKKLFELGDSVDKISAATGLTQEEIEGLCKAIYLKARRS